MQGRVVQINISPGGVPKLPVASARVTANGLEGDGHRDLEHHGGPERALCLFSLEQIRALQLEGHAVTPGAIGENLILEGLDWERVQPGAVLELGERVRIEITRYTSPCFNIKPSFLGGDFARVSQKQHPGWSRVYAKVLQPGTISQGDRVRLLDPS
jgi:MOSC domain-containing protein YiiM